MHVKLLVVISALTSAAMLMCSCAPANVQETEQTAVTAQSSAGVVLETGEMLEKITEIEEETTVMEEIPDNVYVTTGEEKTTTLVPFSKMWLFRYAPASVASKEEQVGDNGDYEDVTSYPPYDTYKLIVDYKNQCVWALSKGESGEYDTLERVMMCSSGGGAAGGWTPEGSYAMGDHRVRFGEFVNDNCYAQYWSNIVGRIYFHSLLYSARSASTYTSTSYRNLGTPASHGCVRLLVPDARWIYYNCAPKTHAIVTTGIEKNAELKYALRHGYEGATDVVSAEQEYPVIYEWQVAAAFEETWNQVLETAKTPYPESELPDEEDTEETEDTADITVTEENTETDNG